MDLRSLTFEGLLGRGAMATVHAARLSSGQRVAVKIGRDLTPRRRERFLTEARALATLDHPRVVSALGLGTCRGEHPFTPDGAPYLVMECGLGTLAPDALASWRELEDLLTDVLRGLAQLHGHGFVHRDVKPPNILRFADGYKLADLGIVADRTASRAEIVGTPMCMAPEQILGSPRDLGPHTDLYATATLAWRVACGAWPFFDLGPVPRAQLEQPLPPFRPRFDVPEGLERWLKILLRRNPYARFRSAAHALADLKLASTGRRAPGATVSSPGHEVPHPTLDLETLQIWSPPPEHDRPPLVHWALPADPPTQVGSLLPERSDLWAVRPLPWVGRDEECDALWRIGRRLVEDHRGGVVVISGARGTGRSRLARWLGRHLHAEAGVRYVVVPAGEGPLGTTLQDVLDGGFRVRGLDMGRARSRLRRMTLADPVALPTELDELLRMLGFHSDPGLLSPEARDRVVTRAIRRTGRLAIVLDDVEGEAPALRSALELLEDPSLPLLLLVTTTDRDLLRARPGVEHLHLEPLSSSDFEQLAVWMGGDATLLRQAALAEDRRPVVAARMFTPVPESVPESRALRLGALLGRSFSFALWRRAAAAAGIPDPEVEAVLASGAVCLLGDDRVELAVDFAIGSAVPGDRALHAAILEVLDPASSPARYAVHAIGAEAYERALGPLQHALEAARAGGDLARLRAVAALRLEVFERIGADERALALCHLEVAEAGGPLLPPDEGRTLAERAIEACRGLEPDLRYRAYACKARSTVDNTVAIDQLRRNAEDDPELRDALYAHIALLQLLLGHRGEARAALESIEVDALVSAAREQYWRGIAELAWQDGDLDRADRACEEARAVSTRGVVAPSEVIRGYVAMERGELDRAEELFRGIVRGMARIGIPLGATDALVGLASVLERRGDRMRAIDLNVEVARIFDARGSVYAAVPLANLALLYLRSGKRDEARMSARRAREIARGGRSPAYAFAGAVLELATMDAEDDWAAALEGVRAAGAATTFWDPDLDRALDLAVEACPDRYLTELYALREGLGVPRETR